MEGQPTPDRRRKFKLVALAAGLLAMVAVLAGGGWALLRPHPARVAVAASFSRPTAAASAATPTETTTPTPTPVPTQAPSARAAAPPVRTPTAPAHPPAALPPPPPAPPPGPPPVTINVPWYHQQYNLSCEESSLSMVLAFFGHPTTEQQIFDQITVDLVHYWAGKPGGGDPFVNFVGDPNGSEVQQTGYGVYWPPIDAAAGQFGATVARAGTGVAPATVYDAVRAGHPVLVWVTFNWLPDARSDYAAYDGVTIPYAGPEEHAMVVTGINGNSVRVNDPDRGQYWVTFSRFEASYAVYGQMAVVFGQAVPPPATPTPSPSPSASPSPSTSPSP